MCVCAILLLFLPHLHFFVSIFYIFAFLLLGFVFCKHEITFSAHSHSRSLCGPRVCVSECVWRRLVQFWVSYRIREALSKERTSSPRAAKTTCVRLGVEMLTKKNSYFAAPCASWRPRTAKAGTYPAGAPFTERKCEKARPLAQSWESSAFWRSCLIRFQNVPSTWGCWQDSTMSQVSKELL